MVRNLEVKDLVKSIEYVTKSTSSSDNYQTFKEEPIFILLYNEIRRFSKEELEGYTEKLRWGVTLFDLALKNPFLLSAFIEQGAYIDKLQPESQWIIKHKNKNNLDNSLYEVIFFIEDDFRRKNRGYINESPQDRAKRNKMLYFLFSYSQIVASLDLLEDYYNDLGKNNPEEIINFVFENAYTSSESVSNEACNFFMAKLHHDKININTKEAMKKMNDFLPKPKDSSFFISSTNIPKIKRLLDFGFKFNEEDYVFKGDNLFMSIIKTERKDIVEFLLPHVTSIKPKTGTLEQQTDFINNGDFGLKLNSLTKMIQSTYNKILLEQNLNKKK